MTGKEVIRSVLALIEEYSEENVFKSDDDDVNKKLIPMINSAMIELCQIKPIMKKRRFTQTASDDTTGYTEYSLGSKLYQIEKVVNMTDDKAIKFQSFANKLLVDNDFSGELEVMYSVYPELLIQDGDEGSEFGDQLEAELEIDKDVQQVLLYAVAGDILKADMSVDYSIFEQKYLELYSRIKPSKSSVIGSVVYPYKGYQI